MDASSFATTNKTHTDKKIPKFHTLVHTTAKVGLNLSRRDNLVFYKLLGLLLKNDIPLIYSNEKLSLETLYKISSIKEALNNLEKLGLIERTGFTYRRRLRKGKVLINICTHSQYCIFLYQYEICTHGQMVAGTSQKLAGTSQKLPIIEVNNNLLKYKEGHQKPQTPKPYNPEYQDYISKIKADKFSGRIAQDFTELTYQEWLNK